MSLFDVGTMTELLNRSLTGGVVILAVLALRLMICLLYTSPSPRDS